MRRVGCLRLFVVALLLAWWATQHFRATQHGKVQLASEPNLFKTKGGALSAFRFFASFSSDSVLLSRIRGSGFPSPAPSSFQQPYHVQFKAARCCLETFQLVAVPSSNNIMLMELPGSDVLRHGLLPGAFFLGSYSAGHHRTACDSPGPVYTCLVMIAWSVSPRCKSSVLSSPLFVVKARILTTTATQNRRFSSMGETYSCSRYSPAPVNRGRGTSFDTTYRSHVPSTVFAHTSTFGRESA
ncbi:hypothetical protein B0H65DRAFT_567153 [Neurospora tetraspora]|uniref:Secreted protein n=1 Tax=Neurospora tetraspora TaxID=94610 RepID=A0AAE0MU36_9PEZI|nr:hypothetical protein B0H65DRAFT_567153 [Neurospora tetraspora]